MATGFPTAALLPTDPTLKAGATRTDDLGVTRRTTSGTRAAIARIAAVAGIAASLSFGAGGAAGAALDPAADLALDLMEDAAAALGDGDDAAYDALVDDAARGDVWLPTTALNALIDRDVENIAFWIDILDAEDDLLLDVAHETITWEREALAALLPGTSSTPDQTDEINDADADGVGLLEVIDQRGLEIPASARLVLEPLLITGEPTPSPDAYLTALADLEPLLEGDAAATDPAPTATVAAAGPTAPSPATPTGTATATADDDALPSVTTVVAETSESSGSPLPMIGIGLLAAAALAVGSFAMLRGRKSDQLADIAFTDGLTGLKNRRRLDADVSTQRERGERATASLMIDVDHFKAFNDAHGHAMGDEVLRLVGDALRQEFRRSDVPYRYGGEEFCVLLNDVTPGEAVSAGERARAAISAIQLPIRERITVSIGVSIGAAEHIGDTIKRADAALYDAKAAGRDRVTFART